MEAAKNTKTDPWDITNLEIVLNNLKKNKSRDPNGLVNELFKKETAVDDLKLATLMLMNRINDEQIYPKCHVIYHAYGSSKGPRINSVSIGAYLEVAFLGQFWKGSFIMTNITT